jgi:O-antigen/teichoic acid export membrane protein
MVGEALRAETAATLPWLALAALMSGFSLYYWSEAFQLTRRTGQRALLMLVPGAVQLTLTAWLSQTQGAVGAAIAAACGASVGAVLLALAGRRLMALPLPLGQLARVGAATAIMALAVIAPPNADTALGLLQSVIVGVVSYVIAAIGFNVMGARDLLLAAARRLQTLPDIANAD